MLSWSGQFWTLYLAAASLWEVCRAQLIELALVSVDKPPAGESSCLCLVPCAPRETGFPLPSSFHSASVTRSACSGLGLMRAAVITAGPCWAGGQERPNSVPISKLLLSVPRSAAERNKPQWGSGAVCFRPSQLDWKGIYSWGSLGTTK